VSEVDWMSGPGGDHLEPNPYESPKTDSDPADRIEQFLLSPFRIPIAIACGLLVILMVWGLIHWSMHLAELRDGLTRREVVFVIIPLLAAEALAFGLMACGLVISHSRIIGAGLLLFLVGIAFPITAAIFLR
jgi:hypothetical protein